MSAPASRRPPPRRRPARLPARVYWFRRLLVLGVAVALVWGVTALIGGGDDARQAAASQDPPASEPTTTTPPTTTPPDDGRPRGYNATAAKKLLTDAGFTYKGSDLYDPKGDRVKFDIHVISGWSDWVASLQIITRNLKDIGIDANVKLEPDWGSWYPNATSTKTVTLLWQTAATGSSFGFFFNNMHKNTYVPSGEDAVNTGNFAHYQNAKATSLLDQWKATLDKNKQKQLTTQLSNLWLDQLPIVPLFIGPQWSTYSTKFFHCFPRAEGLLHASDLQHLPGQRRCADAHLPGRTSRAEQPHPVVPLREPVGGPASPPTGDNQTGHTCAISFDVSGSTRSLSGVRSR